MELPDEFDMTHAEAIEQVKAVLDVGTMKQIFYPDDDFLGDEFCEVSDLESFSDATGRVVTIFQVKDRTEI